MDKWKPMLAHTIEKKRSSVVFPGYVQPKLDGVRCLLTDDGFYSRTGKKILGVPELERSVLNTFNDMRIAGGTTTIEPHLDGELYSTELTFQQIVSSIRRRTNIQENLRISYHIYDIGKCWPYNVRLEYLYSEFWKRTTRSTRERIKLVNTCHVENWDDIEHFMKRFLSLGYEGLMYRHPTATYQFGKRSKYLLKYKHMKTEDVMCVGFKEGEGKYEGMLGALECTCENGSIVWVGTGFDDEQRNLYWDRREKHIDKMLTIKYQEKTDGGVSRFPVFVTWRDYE